MQYGEKNFLMVKFPRPFHGLRSVDMARSLKLNRMTDSTSDESILAHSDSYSILYFCEAMKICTMNTIQH